MKFNKWTLGLAALGVVSLASVAKADEKSNPLMTAVSSTTISGYVDTSAIWKFGTGNANMPGRSFDGTAKQDSFNVNVVSISLDKPIDENQWAAGYHVQMLFGPDVLARGSSTFGVAGNDVALGEAYVALRVPVGNGLDLKVGEWNTFNGYESFDAYKDPNYSRSYGYAIEPINNTGIAASYKVNDMISLQAGVANVAWNNAINATSIPAAGGYEGKKAYLAALTLTAPDSAGFLKGTSLTLGYVNGKNATAANKWNQKNYYAGVSLPSLLDGLSWGLSYDYTRGLGTLAQGGTHSYEQAVALYVGYKATEKLTLNNRLDWAKGSAGIVDTVKTSARQDQLMSETLTADYSLWANVISRVEFRWDHSLTSDHTFNGDATHGTSKNAVSLALNLIYKF